MKWNLTFIILVLSLNAYGSVKMKPVASGHQIYGKETVGAIHVQGPVVLNGTKVQGLTQVDGNFSAQQSLLDSLHVTGLASIKNTHIYKTTYISGSLHADHSSFHQALTVEGNKISLSNCKLNSLYVPKIEGYSGTYNIELRNGTEIKGPIIVESEKGQIWLDLATKAPSKIKGAKIISEKLGD